MELKLPFGIRNGALVDIAQVESGLRCNCFCPACSSPLVARKGNKTVHHFAHHKSAQCEGACQTALHMAAKEILNTHKKMKLPAVIAPLGNYGGVTLFEEQIFEFDTVYLEKKLSDYIPDVILEKDGMKMIVEIAVTHFVDDRKKQLIEADNITTLEIDLSKFDREITLSELENVLLNQTEHKQWIYNRKITLLVNEVKQQATRFNVVTRRMARHIDNCPEKMRVFKGKPYANLIDDCFSCNFLFDSEGDIMDSHTHIYCLGNTHERVEQVILKHKKK